ncbi:TPA: hypothetical protein ACRNW4_003280 [Pseudomonas aeruginosa]|uniref:hypothetical protein n=1 Tax=Pseudomonas aeruginosa TaxID=287 RepID=UPI0003B93E83|nr:hypothetical protein [Pseudomonas aeruginosa]ERY41893.1 hypothetical protein Q066_01576 [Pseudomonas aeruginosa BL12]MBI8135591.1 hypothetical protein [Pseudomonas aeruginosa]MBI8476210.1 hypothetical protein [Pseudomonas aeruginosa]MBI8665542.1 hypothetical protein [Pseudomonas aeruginosa]MBI8917583.1 hypothetical protein [Pseudomonas aeruginosa]
MRVRNNPAGRLLDLLEELRNTNGNTPVRRVFAHMFNADENDTGEVLRLLSDFSGLVRDAKSATSRIANVDTSLYLAPYFRIEEMIGRISLEKLWHQVKEPLDDKVLTELRFGADLLSRAVNGAELDEDEVVRFFEELDALLCDALSSDLPDQLKRLFVKNLESIRHALLAFKIAGADGLQDELDAVLGSIIRHRDEMVKAGDGGPKQKLIERLFALVANINEAVTFSQTAVAIAPPVALFLTSFLAKG